MGLVKRIEYHFNNKDLNLKVYSNLYTLIRIPLAPNPGKRVKLLYCP